MFHFRTHLKEFQGKEKWKHSKSTAIVAFATTEKEVALDHLFNMLTGECFWNSDSF